MVSDRKGVENVNSSSIYLPIEWIRDWVDLTRHKQENIVSSNSSWRLVNNLMSFSVFLIETERYGRVKAFFTHVIYNILILVAVQRDCN